MRKLAEEEILKELRMAEEFFKRNNEFEQTQKGYHFYDEKDDDLEERDPTSPVVSGANEQEQSSPKKEMSWGEMLQQ